MFTIIGFIILGFFTIDSAKTQATTNAVDLNNSLISGLLFCRIVKIFFK